MKNRPPRLAQKFFSWYCRNHLHDSILGDIDEQYFQNRKKYGPWRAKLIYWLVVFQFINRFTLQRENPSKIYYSYGMIKNNLISSLRFLSRNKDFTLINLFGLTIGFTCFVFILFFTNREHSFDQFHKNKDQVYRVNFSFQDNAGNVTSLVNSPPALAAGLGNKFPEIKRISRMRYAMNCMLTNGDVSFYEDHGFYADSLFLETLQFEMIHGDPKSALDQPNNIVISEDLALKYFNKTNAIGETLELNNSTKLNVTGILSTLPTNSHLNFNFLISFSTYTVPEGYSSDLTSWSWLGFLTYIELTPGSSAPTLEAKLIQHFKDLNPNNPNPLKPQIQNLSDIYLGSTGMADDLASHMRSGNAMYVKVLLIIGILVLVIAGFNFTNLTNALSLNRSKSSGIRKVLGANRFNIIIQMLSESLMLALICLTLAIVISMLVFPYASTYMNWEFVPGLEELLILLPLLITSGLITGIIAGLYPAVVLSGFDIIKSLKGTLKIGSRNPFQFKHALVIVQFAIAIGFISATIIISRQVQYLLEKDTGYNSENTVLIKMLPEELSQNFESFKQELAKNSEVLNVSRSERVVGDPWPWSIMRETTQSPEESKRVFFNLTDYDYFETMGIALLEGRTFSKQHSNDETRSIIINKKAAEYLDIENPVGKQVHFFEIDGPRTIIGVVENFNYTSLHQEIGPAVAIMPFIDLEYMYVKFGSGNPAQQIALLESSWNEISPDSPLAWRFLEDNLNSMYQSEEKLSALIQIFSMLSILLACLGLFGIVAFMVNSRMKEFGVRKVLGASIQSLYSLLATKYVYYTLIAMVVILPVVHYSMNNWLENFAYHIDPHWLIYPISTLAMLLMILITISFHTVKAAKANPIRLLRDE
ncbi:MAG: ABC transporter permease [bacterium]|nr:ABC transporter permease [bacterium]